MDADTPNNVELVDLSELECIVSLAPEGLIDIGTDGGATLICC